MKASDPFTKNLTPRLSFGNGEAQRLTEPQEQDLKTTRQQSQERI